MKSLLRYAPLYSVLQRLVSNNQALRTFLNEYVTCTEGMRFLDMGCGPAAIRKHLPDSIDYYGFDPSALYIAAAQAEYQEKATLTVCGIEEFELNGLSRSFDRVLAKGVIHHLNEILASRLLSTAAHAMKSNGILITVDPTFTEPQNPIARWLIRQDRGEYVRRPTEYESLARKYFKRVEVHIETRFHTVPYTVCIMRCHDPVADGPFAEGLF